MPENDQAPGNDPRGAGAVGGGAVPGRSLPPSAAEVPGLPEVSPFDHFAVGEDAASRYRAAIKDQLRIQADIARAHQQNLAELQQSLDYLDRRARVLGDQAVSYRREADQAAQVADYHRNWQQHLQSAEQQALQQQEEASQQRTWAQDDEQIAQESREEAQKAEASEREARALAERIREQSDRFQEDSQTHQDPAMVNQLRAFARMGRDEEQEALRIAERHQQVARQHRLREQTAARSAQQGYQQVRQAEQKAEQAEQQAQNMRELQRLGLDGNERAARIADGQVERLRGDQQQATVEAVRL